MFHDILNVLLIILQVFLLVITFYWIFISFFGIGRPKKTEYKNPEKRFVILVPAHNEENVIGELLDNLNNLDYPKDMYDVYVIADNCTDRTAEIARGCGINVLENTSLPGELRGKPYAIKYALNCLGDLTEKYDGIAFFDADNIVTLNYLKEMNNHLLNGDQLIQCYLDSKNTNDSWVTLAYATSYHFMNLSWQLGKYRLKLGNAVGGTGFCVETHLFQKVGWTARSLTEDLEFTMQCLLVGVRAKWCHNARVYDEKPLKLKSSCVQRLRWARGHWDVCFKYTFPLLKRTVTKLDFGAFDGVIYLLNPAKIISTASVLFIFLTVLFLNLAGFNALQPLWLLILILAYNFIYAWIAIKSTSEVKVNKLKAIISLFIFSVTYIPLFFWASITFKNKTWIRTEHTQKVSMKDLKTGFITRSENIDNRELANNFINTEEQMEDTVTYTVEPDEVLQNVSTISENEEEELAWNKKR